MVEMRSAIIKEKGYSTREIEQLLDVSKSSVDRHIKRYKNCPDFISVDTHWRRADGEWPPNSPDLNPLDYSIWSILEAKACANKTIESLNLD